MTSRPIEEKSEQNTIEYKILCERDNLILLSQLQDRNKDRNQWILPTFSDIGWDIGLKNIGYDGIYRHKIIDSQYIQDKQKDIVYLRCKEKRIPQLSSNTYKQQRWVLPQQAMNMMIVPQDFQIMQKIFGRMH